MTEVPQPPLLEAHRPSFPLPKMPPRVTGADQVMHPVRPCSHGGCVKCNRGLLHPPLLATYDNDRGAWAEAAEAVCVARWIVLRGIRSHASGEICGEPAEHRVAGIDLCSIHFSALERWRFDEARAEEIRQKSRELQEAARELQDATRDYERIAREADAHWERVQIKRSVVYYLRRTSDGMIKIGTSKKYRGRLNTHRGEHGELQILLIRAGSFGEENAAHSKFRDYQIGRTEWFRPARPVLEWIYRARQSHVHVDIQPDDALPLDEMRKLVRAAPRRKDLRWEDGVLMWPPEQLAA